MDRSLQSDDHTYVSGLVAGVLLHYFHSPLAGQKVEPETNEAGDYTGRAILTLPSGRWAVSVEKQKA